MIFKSSFYDESMFRYVTEYRNEFGLLHREDGAALVYSDGDYEYYLNGKLHNVYGPARKIKNSNQICFEYWVYGKPYHDIESFYSKQYKGIKLKQKLRELKLRKMNNINSILSIINLKFIVNDVIDKSKIINIIKTYREFIEVYDIDSEDYNNVTILDISLSNHYIIIKDEKYKILEIKDEN